MYLRQKKCFPIFYSAVSGIFVVLSGHGCYWNTKPMAEILVALEKCSHRCETDQARVVWWFYAGSSAVISSRVFLKSEMSLLWMVDLSSRFNVNLQLPVRPAAAGGNFRCYLKRLFRGAGDKAVFDIFFAVKVY